jgi:hypothetical protein
LDAGHGQTVASLREAVKTPEGSLCFFARAQIAGGGKFIL